MIVAAGLTPAWQHILRFDSFHPGQVNRAVEVHWCASGKVFNVGIALAHLGAECRIVAPVGKNVVRNVRRELESLGVSARLVTAGAPTRVCTTIVDTGAQSVTELVENGSPLSAAAGDRFLKAFAAETAKADLVVLSGSLPQGADSDWYRRMLAVTTARAIIDARGPELVAALDARPLVVKPNREELARTLGRSLADEHSLLSAMRELNDFGAGWVVVTQGAQCVWVTSQTASFRLESLPVPCVVNPIGCGDCLTAGLAWGLSQGLEVLPSLQIGIAAAAQNAAELLPARLRPKEVLKNARRVEITTLT